MHCFFLNIDCHTNYAAHFILPVNRVLKAH